MKKKSAIIIFFFFALLILAVPALSQADTLIKGLYGNNNQDLGVMTGTSDFCYSHGLCSICDFIVVINNIAYFLRSVLGSVALLMFLIGGGLMLLAAGDKNRIQKAKDLLKNSLIGLLIIFFAFNGMNYLLYFFIAEDEDAVGDVTLFEEENNNNSNGILWYQFTCAKSQAQIEQECEMLKEQTPPPELPGYCEDPSES